MTAIMVKKLPPAGTKPLAQIALFGVFYDRLFEPEGGDHARQ